MARVTISACKHKRVEFEPYREYCAVLGKPACSMYCPHLDLVKFPRVDYEVYDDPTHVYYDEQGERRHG